MRWALGSADLTEYKYVPHCRIATALRRGLKYLQHLLWTNVTHPRSITDIFGVRICFIFLRNDIDIPWKKCNSSGVFNFHDLFEWWNSALSDLEEYSSHMEGGWSVYDNMPRGIVEQMLSRARAVNLCILHFFCIFVFVLRHLWPHAKRQCGTHAQEGWEEGVSVGWTQASNSSRRLIHPSWKTQMWPGSVRYMWSGSDKSDVQRKLSLCQLRTRWD